VQADVLPVRGERRGTESLPVDPLGEKGIELLLGRLDPSAGLSLADLDAELCSRVTSACEASPQNNASCAVREVKSPGVVCVGYRVISSLIRR
jgi:hypothetical protein